MTPRPNRRKPRRGSRSGSIVAVAAAAAAVAVIGASCATAPPLPLRSASLEETRESAAGMLSREYPNWATDAGPVPGRVVGLLLPAASKWGRSLEFIGESLVRNPRAYAPLGPERVRTYELHAAGVSPRMLWFAFPETQGAATGSERAVRTLDGEVRSFATQALTPGTKNPWGLRAEAHLAALEVTGGEGNARAPRYELVVTAVQILEGQPGYPRSVVDLLDGARAAFDLFVAAETPRVADLLRQEEATVIEEVPVPAREEVAEAIFPYWDDDRRRLVVLFYRSVTRLTEYGVPCMFVYEGMPAEQRSMQIRHGYGVELGQAMELDATGVLVALRSFDPAPFRIPTNAPEVADSSGRWPVVCPGSPGARRPHRIPGRRPGGPVPPPPLPDR